MRWCLLIFLFALFALGASLTELNKEPNKALEIALKSAKVALEDPSSLLSTNSIARLPKDEKPKDDKSGSGRKSRKEKKKERRRKRKENKSKKSRDKSN